MLRSLEMIPIFSYIFYKLDCYLCFSFWKQREDVVESGLIVLHSIAEHLDMNLVWLVVTWAFLLSTFIRDAAITAAAEPFGILIN